MKKYRDHALAGNWQDFRECHIKPDWLLIYRLETDKLILVRSGSHSDLFLRIYRYGTHSDNIDKQHHRWHCISHYVTHSPWWLLSHERWWKGLFIEADETVPPSLFCGGSRFLCMDNHFHMLIRMLSDSNFTDEEIQLRFEQFHIDIGDGRKFSPEELPALRKKLSSLSDFVREIKLGFTRFYNREHKRRGFFWGGRFKSGAWS